MSVYAVTMVKDEVDVLEGTLRHLASEGVEGIIVADNGSTDGTLELLYKLADDFPCALEVVEDPEVGYYQSRKMSGLATMAADAGADWVVPFDADELWTVPDEVRLVEYLERQERAHVVTAHVIYHLRTSLDVDDPDPFRSMVWRQREAVALPKVAFRWCEGATLWAGNHDVELPGVARGRRARGLEVRHFPVRSAEQFERKVRNGAAAYAAAPDLAEGLGAHWRDYGALLDAGGSEAMRDVYREHWSYEFPRAEGLVLNAAPYRRWE